MNSSSTKSVAEELVISYVCLLILRPGTAFFFRMFGEFRSSRGTPSPLGDRTGDRVGNRIRAVPAGNSVTDSAVLNALLTVIYALLTVPYAR